MLPRAVLFDLDDTLFDHRRASTIALSAMHAAHAPDLAFAAFAQRHAEVLETFHARFLAGEFTLAEARVARMRTLFASFDRQIDDATAARAAQLYREQHQANRSLVTGALELLEALRNRCRLGIVTNNSTAEQLEKLRALDIARYFDAVVISEDVGVTKPDPKIFSIALERIGARAADTVFIGDNWTNDICGALDAGMAAVWLDRDGETQALAGVSEQKQPDRHADAGVSHSRVATIASLTPVAQVIAAIEAVFKNRISGVERHEQLETLAP
jgi:YjjG family noncanonical pyrimidine nucleotidase